MTPEEAVVLILDANLTKYAYKQIRSAALKVGHNMYPEYNKILLAKQESYPDKITITETTCEVPIQNLVEHTIKRLFRYLKLHSERNDDVVLSLKHGFDGSHVNDYRQKYSDTASGSQPKNDIFCVSLVPLKLINKNDGYVYWVNPKPSSTRLCRPIMIKYQKETNELCKQTEDNIRRQINRFQNVSINGFSVSIEMVLTMINGKVCNALNDTLSQRCFICKETISSLNNIKEISEVTVDPNALKYGFSVLHVNIRLMELVLHISYRLELKVKKESQKTMQERKKIIQDGLRKEIGILVDAPTQGAGNTNNGNTARKFFNNIEIVAKVTGFNLELLRRFKIILAVVSSGKDIDVEAFKVYTLKTAQIYAEIYPWYNMPPSLHVIFIHGYKIIESLFLPIGMLSEEAQECNHKNVKYFRDKFSRKHSRLATNTDIFQRLMMNSDPLFSLCRGTSTKSTTPLTEEMMSLLKFENGNSVECSSTERGDHDSSSEQDSTETSMQDESDESYENENVSSDDDDL